MSEPHTTQLADRSIVGVTGPDAAKLLQGLVTNDLNLLKTQAAAYAGLLSPQGKILSDFFLVSAPDGFLLETARETVDLLVKRLSMYRLRANVEIKDVSADYTVAACWGDGGQPLAGIAGAIAYADPRLAQLGTRILMPPAGEPVAHGNASQADYHAHRIGLGVPQGGLDFAYGDIFPHEALLDQLHGVAFGKGCYVGQEIVSRMEHRGTARKRIVPVVASGPLPSSGSDVKAGGVVIGTLGSTCGNRGLALIRLDRAAEFKAKGQPLTVGDVAIEIEIPAWATFTLPSGTAASPTT